MINICDGALQEIAQKVGQTRKLDSGERNKYYQLLLKIRDVRSDPAHLAASDEVVLQPDRRMPSHTAVGAPLPHSSLVDVDDVACATVPPRLLAEHAEYFDRHEIKEIHDVFTEMLSAIRISEPDHENKIKAYADIVNYADMILRASEDIGVNVNAVSTDGSCLRVESESHEAGGGALAIDLDEAVHGLYTALIYTIQASHGNADDIYQSFADNAELLSQDPFGWLKDGVTPHGTLDFGLGVGVAGFLLPFAYLAIKAGIEETSAALSEKGRSSEAIEFAYSRRYLLKRLTQAIRNGPLLTTAEEAAPLHKVLLIAETKLLLEQYRLELLRFVQKQNSGALCVGTSSMVSGGAIGMQAGLTILSKTLAFSGSPAASSMLGVAGFAGAMLMPVAAAGAIGLGGGMVLNSAAGKQRFLHDRNIMETHWQELVPASDAVSISDEEREIQDFVNQYREFLTTKSIQRERFWKIFHALNCVFLSGSTMYSGGAALKTALVSTAGIAALSGSVSFPPALIIAATALIAGGGITMLAGSGQFLSGHGKQHRYGNYRSMNDPQLDRNFLSMLDMMSLLYPEMEQLTGIRQRALFLQQQERKDDLRQDFLYQMGQDQGMRYDGITTHSTDSSQVRARRKEQKLIIGRHAATRFLTRAGFTLKNKKAELKAAGRFLKSAMHAVGSASHLKESYRSARQVTNQRYLAFKTKAASDAVKAQKQGQGESMLGATRRGLSRGARILALPLQVTGKTASHIFRNPVLEAQRMYARKTDHLTLLSVEEWLGKSENNVRLCAFLRQVLQQKRSYLEQKIALKSRLYAIDKENLHHEDQACTIDQWLQAQAGGAQLVTPVKEFLTNVNQDLEQDLQVLQQISLLGLKLEERQRTMVGDAGSEREREQLIDCFLDCEQELPFLSDKERSGSATMRLATYLMEDGPRRYQDHRGILLEAELQSAQMHRMAQEMLAARQI
jgi:hypothetical protein